ncbi:Tetratricopeptide repeat-containing protein [Gillisia sp. Hel1_33_143]|uniref:tetratricopeptide repeat protein n=1 Tax=Gillisia sp. Hel1_33_143 TaxID=1336796 RepID=UPI00087A56DE|nr:tetratricopeptide repeat protein [Gillisia sp. Hel1_33_143]SDR79163.1 Tetratricopeptide repeat-containing protein [Gillisia sp. Hel1_33_143]
MIVTQRFLVILMLFLGLGASAQEMQKGFDQLEKGEFAKAEMFFADILKEYPENKTAKLCYGRAIGLNDQPQEAIALFEEMLVTYPNDLEIQLNYAESLLWNKDYKKAKSYYANLVEEHPDNFGALLGYANTLSNLKEYKPALNYIELALKKSPGNPSAKISQKYIRLGYANQDLQERNYESALNFLDDNLTDFPLDKETLLNKANLYLITKNGSAAKSVYEELAINKNDSILAFSGISLAYHIDEDDKTALNYAEKALELSKTTNDTLRKFEAEERYVQALIWNSKYKRAEDFLDRMKTNYNEPKKILALKATLGMYTGNFKSSINNYQQLLALDATSFDGNLGLANAHFANGEAIEAKQYANTTLEIYKNQLDAQQFLVKLDKSFTPMLEENLSYSYDNGNNRALATTTSLRLPLSTKLEVSGVYSYRNTKNTKDLQEANSNYFSLAGKYQLQPGFVLRANVGLVKATSEFTDFTNLVAEVAAQLKPFSRNDLEIGYRRDLQDFNAELLNRKIAGNHFFLNNNYSTTFGLGWYLQYLYTQQSDDNTRNLLFTSLYYNILKKPFLKGGLNYQYITFKDQVPAIYFSPEKFHAAEVFLSLTQNNQNSKLLYDLTAATGYQFIEDQEKQGTYRLQGKFGYQISDRFVAGIYGNHSNIASATAAGFTYTELGLNLKWFVSKKPIFKY